MSEILSFNQRLKQDKVFINRKIVETLQINIGRICNQACHHCHVESSPTRTENMSGETVDKIIELIRNSNDIRTIDITGGAPELNSHFKRLVVAARKAGKKVIDRCNLTILYEAGQEETATFLKEQKVQVVASLPCYSKENVESQRGRGVFNKSIEGLKLLNSLGYGSHSDLQLDLVYNPLGAFLPPDQEELEKKYKKELNELFNIKFNNLFTITNMPIKRFYKDLKTQNNYDEYLSLLEKNFNIYAAKNVMCTKLISISWDGNIFDCDFNQMLELPIRKKRKDIWTISSFDEFANSDILFKNHCYACTAGAGSSCGGSLL